MPAYEKVDGKWRGVWSVHVKVDGVWRDTDMSGKVDKLWRSSHKHIIEESDIVGFRLVYRVNPNKTHPDFPNLKTNLNMPIEFSVSGEYPGMNISTKGVLFHYERFGDEEGILMYEGSLYAVLTNGCLVDVGLSKNTMMNRYQGGAKSGESSLTMPKTISDAWVSKMKQAYQKAEVAFPNDPAFSSIQKIYYDKMNELKIKV